MLSVTKLVVIVLSVMGTPGRFCLKYLFSVITMSVKMVTVILLSAINLFAIVLRVEWLFTETPFHRSGFSPNVLFTEKAAIHLWDCSPNVL